MAKYDVSFKVGEEGSEDVIKQLEKIQKYLSALTKGTNTVKVDTDIDTSGIDQASKKTESYREQVTSLGDAFQGLGSVMMGSGNLLQQFASFFGSDVIGTATRTITSYATVLASNGFSKSISRYDTMTTFPKMMSMMGYDAEQATEAVNTLNDAVLGLPTSLSDIVEQAQTFTTLTGDLDKGVQYAIAANNTFLAGGADTSQVYYGTKQLQDLISSGELKTMEWQSLIKAMGPAWREIGKEMGYTEDELIDFRSSLIAGDIDGDEFLDAMVRAATGTGQLAEMAGLSKEKISSSLENIQTAFASTGQAIIETLDESFQAAEGMTLAEKIQEIGSAIKTDLKPYLVEFVQDNFPKIQAFIDKIEGYDWMGMISKIAEWAGMLLDFYSTLITKIPSGVVAFGMTWASPLGKILSGLGSFIYGLGNTSFLKGIKLGSVTKGIGSVGEFVGGLGNIGLKLVNSAGSIAILGELGLVIKQYTGVIEAISDMKIGGNFTKNLKSFTAFFASAGGITAGLVAIMSAFTGAGLGGIVGVGELLSAGFVGIVAMTGEVISEYANIINEIGGLSLNSTRLKKNLQVISDSMIEMQTIMGVNGLISFVEGVAELAGAGIVSLDMAAMNNIIDTIVKIAEIDDLDVDFGKLNSNISNIKKAINILTENEGIFSALGKADTTYYLSKATENASNMFSAWTSIIQSYKDAFVNEDGTLEDNGEIAEQIKTDAKVIKDVVQAMTDQYGPLSALLDKWATDNMGDTVENIDDILSTWSDILSNFKSHFYDEEGNSIYSPEEMGDLVTQITEAGHNIRTVINSLTGGSGAILDWLGSLQTSSLSDSVENVNTILDTWKTIISKVATTDLSYDVATPVTNMVEQVQQIMDLISGVKTTTAGPISMTTGNDLFSRLGNFFGKKTESGTASSIADSVDYILEIVRKYKSMQTIIQSFELDDSIVEKLKQLFTNVSTIFEGLYAPDLTGTAGSIESWQLVLDSMETLVSQIITIGELAGGDGSTAFTKMQNLFVTRFTAFKDRLAEMELEEMPEKIEQMRTMFRGLDGMLNYITAMDLDSPAEKINQLENMVYPGIVNFLNYLSVTQGLLANLGAGSGEIAVVTMLKDLITGLVDATGGIEGADFGQLTVDLIALGAEFMSFRDDLLYASNAVQVFYEGLFYVLNPELVTTKDNVSNIDGQLLILIDNLSSYAQSIADFSNYFMDLNDWILEVEADLDALTNTDLPALVEAIGTDTDTIINDSLRIRVEIETLKLYITQFIDLALTPLQDKNEEIYTYIEENILLAIAETQQSVLDLNNTIVAFMNTLQLLINKLVEVRETLDSVTKAVNRSKNAFNSFNTRIDTTAAKVRNLKDQFELLRLSINSLPTNKTISITTTGLSTGGLVGGKRGVLYRAKGGFTPKGTDTVPAMLTPGEFVMNRNATKKLGPAFLRRLNHGDIAGAMARASRRYGMTGNYNVSHITNHDNHATVNQYITTNNEQFSYRRASRFVEAF